MPTEPKTPVTDPGTPLYDSHNNITGYYRNGIMTGSGSNATITSSSLAQTNPISPVQPESTPTYPVASLGTINTTSSATPPLQMTAQEQQQSEIAKQLADLNQQESGKAQYQADLYKQAGFGMTYDANGNIVPDAGTADLSAKLKSLQNEALAIPQQLQLEASGRGITAGGLQPIETAALRNNAIQALGVSSLIAAKNGQLETAQHLVNNAIIQKYGPIEAKIKALQANLELIKNDPATSLADKNRAQAQLDIQNKKAADVADQKENQKGAMSEAIKYAGVADAATLTEMQNAPTALAVALIAAKKGLTSPTGQPAAVLEFEYAKKNGYTGTFSDYQNEDANRKRSIAAAGVAGLGTKQYNALNQITTRFQADPVINQSVKGQTAAAIADQVIADPNSATSQLKSLYILVKNLDPDSAVREGELALANQTQSYLQVWGNTLARINEGRVISPDAAKKLATATKELMSAWNATAKRREKQYRSQANTLSIGSEFDSYIQGSELGYNTVGGGGSGGGSNPLGI